MLPNLFGNTIINVLPAITRNIAQDDLVNWKQNLEAVDHEIMRPVLNQWDQIPVQARPMYVLEKVCDYWDINCLYRRFPQRI